MSGVWQPGPQGSRELSMEVWGCHLLQEDDITVCGLGFLDEEEGQLGTSSGLPGLEVCTLQPWPWAVPLLRWSFRKIGLCEPLDMVKLSGQVLLTLTVPWPGVPRSHPQKAF